MTLRIHTLHAVGPDLCFLLWEHCSLLVACAKGVARAGEGGEGGASQQGANRSWLNLFFSAPPPATPSLVSLRAPAQVFVLALTFLVLFLGNFLTTLKVVHTKLQKNRNKGKKL